MGRGPLPLGEQIADDDPRFTSDDEDELEDDPTDDESDESDEAPEDKSGGDAERIRSLMSNWQKETARANRLEDEVKALRGAPASGETPPPGEVGGEVAEHLSFMRDMTRETLFTSDPRLARYGLDSTAIDGNTPAQMRVSLKRLQGMMDRVEQDASSRTLRKHGIVPDQSGGGGPATKKKKSYDTMSDDEINRVIAEAKSTL